MSINPGLVKFQILYADDDEDDLALIRQEFEKFSDKIELITAEDGTGAIRFLESLAPHAFSPCLVILDINMPGMSGKDALKEIRGMERYRDTPVVFFTTSSHSADKEFARRHNAGFVTKPILASEIKMIAATLVKYCHEDMQNRLGQRVA